MPVADHYSLGGFALSKALADTEGGLTWEEPIASSQV